MSEVPHWTTIFELRPEIRQRRGHAEGLQMSLYDAVYQTADVPYRDCGYWCDITEPTTKLVEFIAEVACQLTGETVDGRLFSGDSLFHLDQGMGGGKSHALCGLWHLATNPTVFFASEIGAAVSSVAEARTGSPVQLDDVRAVVLCADHFSPGVARAEFGPATTLHQRFLWSLFDGDRTLYDEHVHAGADKAALRDAIVAAGRPVLILLDEIMDYAMALAAPEHRGLVEAEQAFLNALTGAVNDTARAAMVVVMIRSDLDEQGYDGVAAEFRDYLSRRLERNGTTVSVNEPQDFGAIISRRIFARGAVAAPVAELAAAWHSAAGSAWSEHVFARLPGARQLGGFEGRLARSYPFHPDLLDLIEHDWTQHAGFQRVRSTVEVFAATAYHWAVEAEAGRWAPELIGVGDIPLHAAADEVLSSGLLHGNERQIVGMRQVAEKDVTSRDRSDGQAVGVDRRVCDGRAWADVQPQPAVRLATALWMYSVAVRAQGKRGATKAELLAALYVPDERFGFGDAEEVFNALCDDEDERGLGALDVIAGGGGNQPNRYVLVTQLNKRMFHRNALSRVTPEDSYALVWERVRRLASRGAGFDTVIFAERPGVERGGDTEIAEILDDVDQRRCNRLVVLDPRRWTLLNGRDSATRSDIETVLGVGAAAMPVEFAASCVIACVNTQRRDSMVKRARSAAGWRLAAAEHDPGSEIGAEIAAELETALAQLDAEVRRAFQHYAYLVRDDTGLRVEFVKFDDDNRTSLSGNHVWDDMANRGDAVGAVGGLAGSYLHQLLDLTARKYTLGEVVEKFWRDPVFPIVANETVVRRAIFDALRPDADGVAWALVGADDQPLAVTQPEQLAINASDQYLCAAAETTDGAGAVGGVEVTSSAPAAVGAGAAQRTGGAGSPAASYQLHRLRLTHQSLTETETRRSVWMLLSTLADRLDPLSGADVQVADLTIEINAAAGSLDGLDEKAADAGATWDVTDEDF